MTQHNRLMENGQVALQALLLVLAAVPLAAAEPQIPTAIREGNSSPRGAEQVIEQYVDHWITALSNGEGPSARKVREALTEPLRSPGSDIFKSAYSGRLSSRLGPSLASDDVVMRLNAVMAVGHLVDPGAVGLIEKALADTRMGSSAIHLHAARSAARLATAGRLRPEDEAVLVKGLRKAYQTERAQPAIAEIMKALGSLSSRVAGEVLLDIINTRTSLHATNPRLPIRAEIEGMTRLWRDMTHQDLENRLEKNDPRVHQMGQAGHRYLFHCATWLREADSDDPLHNDHARMAKLSDEVLRLVIKVFDKEAQLPEKVEREIDKQRWEEVVLRCREWENVMMRHGFTAKQLEIPAPEKRPSPPQPGDADRQTRVKVVGGRHGLI